MDAGPLTLRPAKKVQHLGQGPVLSVASSDKPIRFLGELDEFGGRSRPDEIFLVAVGMLIQGPNARFRGARTDKGSSDTMGHVGPIVCPEE
jgi:hypothetical protein